MAAGPGRALSTAMKAAVTAAQTSAVALAILEIDHSDLGSPIRVVNNNDDITSNGNVYSKFPFLISLPDDDHDQLSNVTLQIDNVDRQIVTAIRTMSNGERPTVAFSIILSASPDTIEAGPFNFSVQQTSADAFSVYAQLAFEDILNMRFPSHKITPQTVPGIF